MSIKWKYVEKLDSQVLKEIEGYFKVELPADYKKELINCNRGKPVTARFDIAGRKECILDYMVNLEESIEISKRIKRDKLIPIGTDPFGNVIAYKIDDSGKISSIIFWDHETKKDIFIADNFTSFLEKLY